MRICVQKKVDDADGVLQKSDSKMEVSMQDFY